MEHLQHFGLPQDPFSNELDLRFYFESASHRDAQRRVERGLRQQKGLTLLTGEGGMGKTLLARRVLESLEDEVFEATLLVMLPGAADATSILQRFARQIGCEEPANDRATLLGQLYEQLAIIREDGRHAVLIVDDAQVMTPEVFSELGGLLNLEYEDRRLVSMLFVGSPELDRLVENDASIMPRVDVRVRLHALDMANTTAYLNHRISSVKGNLEVLSPDSIEALFKFGRGRPRLINTLADNALFEAYLAGRPAIDASDVERAAADLGVGPDPGTTYTHLASVPTGPVVAVADDSFATSTVAAASVSPLVGNGLDAGALDLDEPVTNFELTPEPTPTPTAAPTPQPEANASGPTLDLDAGLEAALEDFEETTDSSRLLESSEFGGGSLDLDMEVSGEGEGSGSEPMLELVDPEPSFESELPGMESLEEMAEAEPLEMAEAEPLEMAEAELSPLAVGEADELDDAFVELLEE